jgi:Cdc6-like AAA superfamily ATPase
VPLSITLKAAWKPFRAEFEQYLMMFRQHAKRIEKEARLAHRIETARMLEVQLANQALQIQNNKLQKRHTILSLIPSIDYQGKYLRYSNFRHPGTSTWFNNSPQYCAWRDATKSDCLCFYGIPGSGKSILVTSIVDTLLLGSSAEDFVVLHYYCDFADAASLESYNLIASLLRQTLQLMELDNFSENFQCPFQEAKCRPTLETMFLFFLKLLQDFREVFIIVDGLDELAADDQTVILSRIEEILQGHSKAKMLITSRIEEFRIKRAMSSYHTVHLSEESLKEDITLVIRASLAAMDDISPLSTNEKLRDEVAHALNTGAKGM